VVLQTTCRKAVLQSACHAKWTYGKHATRWSYCGHATEWSYRRHAARRSYSQLATLSGLTASLPQCGLTGVVPHTRWSYRHRAEKTDEKCAAFHPFCGFITSPPRNSGTYSKHATWWSYSGHATEWTYSWHATWWCRETGGKCRAFRPFWFSYRVCHATLMVLQGMACHSTEGLTAACHHSGLTGTGMPLDAGSYSSMPPQWSYRQWHATRWKVLQEHATSVVLQAMACHSTEGLTEIMPPQWSYSGPRNSGSNGCEHAQKRGPSSLEPEFMSHQAEKNA
jgi:hypothetical protein